MEFSGFTNEDFEVFSIDGFEPRMEALKLTIRPKLEALGDHFAPTLSSLTGNEMFSHVAKHARRTVNPPKDTWVAFSPNPRGYKMVPHFQIGMWETHVFIWFAIIYEAPGKAELAKKFEKKASAINKHIPKGFVWSEDHTKPDAILHGDLGQKGLKGLLQKVQTVKKAELLCGCFINRDDAIKMPPREMLETIENTFKTLLPLYQIS